MDKIKYLLFLKKYNTTYYGVHFSEKEKINFEKSKINLNLCNAFQPKLS